MNYNDFKELNNQGLRISLIDIMGNLNKIEKHFDGEQESNINPEDETHLLSLLDGVVETNVFTYFAQRHNVKIESKDTHTTYMKKLIKKAAEAEAEAKTAAAEAKKV